MYLQSMDLFNGESQATGLLNEAKGFRYSGELAKEGGEEAQKASYLAAGGQLLSSAGSAFKIGSAYLPSSGGPLKFSSYGGFDPNKLSGLY